MLICRLFNFLDDPNHVIREPIITYDKFFNMKAQNFKQNENYKSLW